MPDKLNQAALFASGVYSVSLPQFLEPVRAVSAQALQACQCADAPPIASALYPHQMTGNYNVDERVREFAQYVAQTAWNILESQGYAMQHLVTAVLEMWTQEHHPGSDMPVHVHPGGMQVCAFYFLDCPQDGNQLVMHDPRPGKCAAQPLQADMSKVTAASDMILFKPEPGLLVLANAWLPHSFTRNGAKEPCRFVHMNIGALPAPPTQPDHETVIL